MTFTQLYDRAARIEDALLRGNDRIEVEDDWGLVVRRTVYEIPRWRDKPIIRFRIWRLRRAYHRWRR
jgi:hypothetical protein